MVLPNRTYIALARIALARKMLASARKKNPGDNADQQNKERFSWF